jgi:DedD protein
MALPSFFKRKVPKPAVPAAPDPTADDAGSVQAARTRARRRLIGAVVLLAIGVIGFPMLFETQPRPLPGDIPIELPRREGQPAPSSLLPREPPAPPDLPRAADPPPAAVTSASAVLAEAPAPAPPPALPAERRGGDNPPASPPAVSAQAKAAAARPASADAASAAGEAKATRFVVQVGAYTDAGTLRDVRAKVEKLGLKTYTQSIETDAGKRTRVRVGPFATRQEAEGASGKLKAAGLPGNVLVL